MLLGAHQGRWYLGTSGVEAHKLSWKGKNEKQQREAAVQSVKI